MSATPPKVVLLFVSTADRWEKWMTHVSRTWLKRTPLDYVVLVCDPALNCPYRYNDDTHVLHLRVDSEPQAQKIQLALQAIEWLFKPTVGVLRLPDSVYVRPRRLQQYIHSPHAQFEGDSTCENPQAGTMCHGTVYFLGRRAIETIVHPDRLGVSSEGLTEALFLQKVLAPQGMSARHRDELVTKCMRTFFQRRDTVAFYLPGNDPSRMVAVANQDRGSTERRSNAWMWWLLVLVLVFAIAMNARKTPLKQALAR